MRTAYIVIRTVTYIYRVKSRENELLTNLIEVNLLS